MELERAIVNLVIATRQRASEAGHRIEEEDSMIGELIYLAFELGVLYLVYVLGTLLIGLIPDAKAQRIVGIVWIVLCVLIALSILLGAIGVADLPFHQPRLIR